MPDRSFLQTTAVKPDVPHVSPSLALIIFISPDHRGPWNGDGHSPDLTSRVGQPRVLYPFGASQAWGSDMARRPPFNRYFQLGLPHGVR